MADVGAARGTHFVIPIVFEEAALGANRMLAARLSLAQLFFYFEPRQPFEVLVLADLHDQIAVLRVLLRARHGCVERALESRQGFLGRWGCAAAG